MDMQWLPFVSESQQEAAWRILVVRVVFDDYTGCTGLPNLLFGYIPLHQASEDMQG